MTFILIEGKKKFRLICRVVGLSLLVILFLTTGNISCKKEAEEGAVGDEVTVVKAGMNEFEGVVKVSVGKYFFIPGAKGIDMILQGESEAGDASSLVDKEVRVRGEFSPESPSILVVDSIDVKEEDTDWRNIFTRTEEAVLDDYVDSKVREEFEVLKDLDYKEKEGWEGKGKVKIYGKLEKTTITEGEEEKDVHNIIVLDEKENEVGKVIVDSITDYAQYYLKKLRLFDKFWFYADLKETVEWGTRRTTRELFHADVVFAGLF